MKKIIVLIIIIGVVILIWSYGQNPTPTTTSGEDLGATLGITPTGEGVITTPPTPDTTIAANVKEFTVISGNFSFTPKTLEVNQGDTVKIIFQNANGTHALKIDEFNVAIKQIKAGESETVEFVADKTGIFEYYCSIGNHRAMGMVGTLTVK